MHVVFRDVDRIDRVPLSDAIVSHVKDLQLDLSLLHRALDEKRFDDFDRDRRSRGALRLPLSVGETVLIAEANPVNALVPRWSRLGIVKQVCSAWTYLIEEMLEERTTEQHISNLRPLASDSFRQDLNDFEKVLWTALNRLRISHIDDFRTRGNLLECHIVWADAAQPPTWENVAEWHPRLPRYFHALSLDGNFPLEIRHRLADLTA